MLVFSEVSLVVFYGAYSQKSMFRITALQMTKKQ